MMDVYPTLRTMDLHPLPAAVIHNAFGELRVWCYTCRHGVGIDRADTRDGRDEAAEIASSHNAWHYGR
jgi:hypothetical protein